MLSDVFSRLKNEVAPARCDECLYHRALARVNSDFAQALAGQVRLVAVRIGPDHVPELDHPLRALDPRDLQEEIKDRDFQIKNPA